MAKLKCGLIGERLGHSYSKQIHAVFGNYEYEHISVPRDEAATLIQSAGFDGLNVTIPYKKLAFSLCDEVSETARATGSVNTIVYRDGKRYGYNTDCFGFRYMSERAGISLSGKRVLILGSGGTSETARAVCAESRARGVTVISRRGEANYENISQFYDAEVIINTTPVGMYPDNGKSAVSLDAFPQCESVIDVIYNPLKTALLLSAEARKIRCTNGLFMLAAQGKRAAELFMDKKLPDAIIGEAAEMLYKSFSNIVLIGMPGSGKSEIGKAVARLMGRSFTDTDAVIAKCGRTPAQIIENDGEDAFRTLETRAAAETGRERSLVIATGGGVVERAENYGHLAQNGRVYWIQRATASLAREGRPLSGDVAALYERRHELYRSFFDVRISNDGSIEEAARKIVEDFRCVTL